MQKERQLDHWIHALLLEFLEVLLGVELDDLIEEVVEGLDDGAYLLFGLNEGD